MVNPRNMNSRQKMFIEDLQKKVSADQTQLLQRHMDNFHIAGREIGISFTEILLVTVMTSFYACVLWVKAIKSLSVIPSEVTDAMKEKMIDHINRVGI